MTPAETIIATLLNLFPHMSGHNRACIVERTASIASSLTELTSGTLLEGAPPLPLDLLTAVAFIETHLGCDANEGGNWGAPIDAQHRHTAGTPRRAATILARSYLVCGSWEGAVLRFNTGMCRAHNLRDDVAAWGLHYQRGVRSLRLRLVRGR